MNPQPRFSRHAVGELANDTQPAAMNTFFRVGDINGDGRPDLVVGGRNGRLAWFENPGRVNAGPWTRHVIEADLADRECGGTLVDLTGNGCSDVIVGGDYRSDTLLWWKNPGQPGLTSGRPWTCRQIVATGANQIHDALVGDVTGDGQRSLIFNNQGGATLYRLPVPPDPRVSPWPGLEIIATDRKSDNGQPEEGIALADIDGDGQNEIIAGCFWYKRGARTGRWDAHRFAPGDWITTVIAVGDVDGCGRPEIVLSEGDACIYGREGVGGRVSWFKPGADIRAPWTEHRVAAGLLDPHSLLLADFSRSGRLDLVVGEIGLKNAPERGARLVVFTNDGQGHFTPHETDGATGTHHAALADFENRGALDIASRPLHGPEKWNVFVWRNEDGRGSGVAG